METQTYGAVTGGSTPSPSPDPMRTGKPDSGQGKSKMKMAAAGVLIVVVVVGLFLWLGRSRKGGTDKIAPGVSVSPADWKTYSNGDYGLSLKYPKDWTVRNDAQPCTVPAMVDKESIPSGSALCIIDLFSFAPKDGDDAFDPQQWPKDGFVVSLSVGFNPGNGSVEEYIAQDEETAIDDQEESSDPDTLKVFSLGTNSYKGFDGGDDGDPYYFGPYYLDPTKDDLMLSATASFSDDGADVSEEQMQERQEIMRTILSNVRFQ